MAQQFFAITAEQTKLLMTIILGSPAEIGNVEGQLAFARTREHSDGWLDFRISSGRPCWNEGWPPFIVPLYGEKDGYPGPFGLTDIFLWFNASRMLESLEIIYLNGPGNMPCSEISVWLADRQG